MCADILPEYPGMEVYCGERDYAKRWLYSAEGKLVQFMEKDDLTLRPIWWDEDDQRRLLPEAKLENGVTLPCSNMRKDPF